MAEEESVQIRYEVAGAGGSPPREEVARQVREMLERLATDERTRQAARSRGIDIDEFDRIRARVESQPETEAASAALIEVREEGAGVEPGTVLIAVTIIPPVLKHVVGPLAVHVGKSIWDEFVLPELKSWFKKFKQRDGS